MRDIIKFVFFCFKRSPVVVVFFCSIVLSVIAISGEVTVGKDAAYYLDIAQDATAHGWAVAQQRFNWPWFILLLSVSHQLTGLSLELLAYGWSLLFMAGSCALMVACVRREVPQATWWAALVVLAVPAFNQFRGDILREFGFWFFSILSLWLALSWQVNGGRTRLCTLVLSVAVAALFRLEALFLFGALALWQLPGLFRRETRLRALKFQGFLILLVVLALAAFSVLIFTFDFPLSRIGYYAKLLGPSDLLSAFQEFSGRVSDGMLHKYSREDTGLILFFGIFVLIALKVAKLFGPFSVVFFFKGAWRDLGSAFSRFSLFAWAAALYFMVLLVFFIQQQFAISRYLSFLNWLLVPPIAILLLGFSERWPRLSQALIVVALLVMLSNVISTSAKKTHYLEAATWLKENISARERVYYDDLRISYYAGFGYPINQMVSLTIAMQSPEAYDYFLIEADGDEPELLAWLAEHQLRLIISFANRRNARVLVIGR